MHGAVAASMEEPLIQSIRRDSGVIEMALGGVAGCTLHGGVVLILLCFDCCS